VKNMDELLEILEKNNKLTTDDISKMLGKSAEEIEKAIKEYEEKNIILGYKTIINWDKTDKEAVTAIIELKITPEIGKGFDNIAEKIYKYKEVKSCFLMSGGYDLSVVVEGKNMKEVAYFVAEKLAVQDSVISTATHFVLKKYKDNEVIFKDKEKDDREAIIL
jgi:DNA-binding Lrp family transcriptional regulator